MTTTALHINGLTCGHCVSAVTSELLEVKGITAVDINLVAGGASPATVTSEGPLDLDAVREAVAEAGEYTVTA